ncbi:type II toxin-antitoxin system VapC family toxin [Thiohalocapsa sp. ML1]|jgi:uncharacterized protein|uniref:type II toxin-antitoxin system VapC family toxin n=1 Tax=Thiohalocapsa sp. ML1 TaxID=1431688 RepID=UPI0009EBD387|nr:type II toxin-antitoxin system VapC family toxin [Thiohalocapsa sp. ML1]
MPTAYLDTCIVIYLIERADPFFSQVIRFLSRHANVGLCVSPLVRLETVVKPMRDGNLRRVADYDIFLSSQRWLTCTEAIFVRAAELRASHGLKTPDALHLATALHHGCDAFWTNDTRLNMAAGGLARNLLAM